MNISLGLDQGLLQYLAWVAGTQGGREAVLRAFVVLRQQRVAGQLVDAGQHQAAVDAKAAGQPGDKKERRPTQGLLEPHEDKKRAFIGRITADGGERKGRHVDPCFAEKILVKAQEATSDAQRAGLQPQAHAVQLGGDAQVAALAVGDLETEPQALQVERQHRQAETCVHQQPHAAVFVAYANARQRHRANGLAHRQPGGIARRWFGRHGRRRLGVDRSGIATGRKRQSNPAQLDVGGKVKACGDGGGGAFGVLGQRQLGRHLGLLEQSIELFHLVGTQRRSSKQRLHVLDAAQLVVGKNLAHQRQVGQRHFKTEQHLEHVVRSAELGFRVQGFQRHEGASAVMGRGRRQQQRVSAHVIDKARLRQGQVKLGRDRRNRETQGPGNVGKLQVVVVLGLPLRLDFQAGLGARIERQGKTEVLLADQEAARQRHRGIHPGLLEQQRHLRIDPGVQQRECAVHGPRYGVGVVTLAAGHGHAKTLELDAAQGLGHRHRGADHALDDIAQRHAGGHLPADQFDVPGIGLLGQRDREVEAGVEHLRQELRRGLDLDLGLGLWPGRFEQADQQRQRLQ